jgi:hypothetical protein
MRSFQNGSTRASVSFSDSEAGRTLGSTCAYRRSRDVVTAAPDLHLRLAVLLHGLRLVEPLQRAVVALVQAPASFHRQPHEIQFVQHAPHRADGALEHGREHDVGLDARLLDLGARGFRLDAPELRQVDVVPAREQIFDVPYTLAVTNQD